MHQGIIIQIILICAGIITMILTIGSLAKRKMAEQICIAWGFVAVILVLSGLILRPDRWVDIISTAGLVVLVVLGFCILVGTYLITVRLSEVIRKNNELAMQVSLLNEEVLQLKKKLEMNEEEEQE